MIRGSIVAFQILIRSSAGSFENDGKAGMISAELVPDMGEIAIGVVDCCFSLLFLRKTRSLKDAKPTMSLHMEQTRNVDRPSAVERCTVSS